MMSRVFWCCFGDGSVTPETDAPSFLAVEAQQHHPSPQIQGDDAQPEDCADISQRRHRCDHIRRANQQDSGVECLGQCVAQHSLVAAQQGQQSGDEVAADDQDDD